MKVDLGKGFAELRAQLSGRKGLKDRIVVLKNSMPEGVVLERSPDDVTNMIDDFVKEIEEKVVALETCRKNDVGALHDSLSAL